MSRINAYTRCPDCWARLGYSDDDHGDDIIIAHRNKEHDVPLPEWWTPPPKKRRKAEHHDDFVSYALL